MTTLLEQAVAKAQHLSPGEQDALAKLILDEIESDRRWEQVVAKSPEKLAKLADRAWAEHEGGKSEPLEGQA